MDTLPALLQVSHSCSGRRWTLRNQDADKSKAIRDATGVSALVADMLSGRNVGPNEAPAFLDPTLRGLMPDPSSFQDMDKAAGLILDAIEQKRSITVFADYDVDGGTSAAQLIRWARVMGSEFGLYVPDRVAEGYGPSVEAFQALKASGVELVITVDCGAAATQALQAARDFDMPIIVVDHHLMGAQLPPCAALINPNRADDTSGQGHLAAAGVTFILLAALSREARRRGKTGVPDIRRFLDLAAMGTICDVVPLTGVNRAIVRQGLKVLTQRQNSGLAALAQVAGATGTLSTYHAGYILGPRINAGGRIGRADMGAQMLSSDDPDLIMDIAQQLDTVNKDRKLMQADMLTEAMEKASKLPEACSVILVSMSGWHPGVIGIVAGRLKDKFNKPAIVIGINDQGIGKGSGRSLKGVNLGGAISAAKDAGLLQSGGGHEMAAGLTVLSADVDAFTDFIQEHLADDVAAARKGITQKVDAIITVGAINETLLEDVAIVGPFGAGNPQPVFALESVSIVYAERVKGGFVRATLEDANGARLTAICFKGEESGIPQRLLSPKREVIHVIGAAKRNEWKGRVKVDFEILDVAALN